MQVAGVSRCTGFLLDARTAITAAHCLYSSRVRHMVRPDSVHVLSLYQRGSFAAHTLAVSYRVAQGWLPLDQAAGSGADAVALTLAAPLGSRFLTLSPARPGQAAMLGGYERDRAQILLADRECRVMGTAADAKGRPLRQHSCAATFGTSGAPLLVRAASGEWAAAGVQVVAVEGAAGGATVPSETLAALIASK